MLKKIKYHIQEKIKQIRFLLSASNNPIFIAYYKYVYRPKSGSISEFLDEYSRSISEGLTVVQIGANDGITHDPIHKFIKRDHWKGVLLEPQSYVYEHFLKNIYQKNEGIHPICAAIGEKDGIQSLYKIDFCNMRWATGLASFEKEIVENAFSIGLVQKKCLKYGIKMPSSENWISSEEVSIISPTTLLRQYKLKTIDLLQIDVEGYDAEVVRIFEIKKTRPTVIIFENSHLSKDDHYNCLQHLEDQGYKTRLFGANTLAMVAPSGKFSRYFST